MAELPELLTRSREILMRYSQADGGNFEALSLEPIDILFWHLLRQN
jgi:hypothetical protein